jgi:hypothetical protein
MSGDIWSLIHNFPLKFQKIKYFLLFKNSIVTFKPGKKGGDNGGWGKLTQKINKMQKLQKSKTILNF